MAGKFVKVKKVIVPIMALAMLAATGCGSTSGDKSEVLNTPNEVQEMNVISEQNEPEQDTEQDDLTEPEQDEPEQIEPEQIEPEQDELEQSEPEQDEPEENNPDYNVTGADNNTTSTQSNAGAEKIDTGVYPEDEQEEVVDNTEQSSSNNSSTSSNNSSSSFDSDGNYIGVNSVDAAVERMRQQLAEQYSPEEQEEALKMQKEAMESGKLQGLSEWAAGNGSSSTSESADQFGNSGISISVGGDTSSSDSPDAGSGMNLDVGGGDDSTSDSTDE